MKIKMKKLNCRMKQHAAGESAGDIADELATCCRQRYRPLTKNRGLDLPES